jgi:hypothetical protein
MGLFGSKGTKSEKSNQQTQQNTEQVVNPFGAALPGFTQLFQSAFDQLGTPEGNIQPFPASTVAPLSQDTRSAIDIARANAGTIDPILLDSINQVAGLQGGTTAGQLALKDKLSASSDAVNIARSNINNNFVSNLANFNASSGNGTGTNTLTSIANSNPLSGIADVSSAGRQQLLDAISGSTGTPASIQSRATLEEIANNTDFENNPALQGAIDDLSRNATNTFNRTVLPGISSRFASAGRFGSGAQSAALNQAGETFGRELTGGISNLVERNLRDQQTRRADAAKSLAGLDLNVSQLNEQARNSDAQRRFAGASNLINDDFNRANFKQSAASDALDRSLNAGTVLESARQRDNNTRLSALTSAAATNDSAVGRFLDSANFDSAQKQSAANDLIAASTTAAGLGNTLSNTRVLQDQRNLDNLIASGALGDNFLQRNVDSEVSRFNQIQNADFERLRRLAEILSASAPFTQTNSTGNSNTDKTGSSKTTRIGLSFP